MNQHLKLLKMQLDEYETQAKTELAQAFKK